jgi:hypothetical protein
MTRSGEMLLPPDLQELAFRSGSECGWSPDLIPRVIDEAGKLSLLSFGGQLQFLLPQGTCECYWVTVEPLNSEPEGWSWDERVAFAADASRHGFTDVRGRFDFLAEVRSGFKKSVGEFEKAGGDLSEAMCFIWYLEANAE